MKRSSNSILTLIAALAAVVLAVFAFTACGGRTVKHLAIENAKIDFIVGDEFELGDDFAAYATFSDGSKTEVTNDVVVRKESGFDMSVEGEYQITISYGGKKVVYSIYVNGFDNILRKIELNTENAKLNYQLGEELSFDGLIITSTYENAQGRLFESSTQSLKDFTVVITDKDGNVTDESFSGLGDYTVTISKGSISASYTVAVDGINISSVQSALNVSKAFKSEVVSGTQKLYGALHGGELYDDDGFSYVFGDNYTYVKQESKYDTYEFHYSMEGNDIFCVTQQNGKIVPNGSVNTDMMNGAPIRLWYSDLIEYGIDSALTDLYNSALVCTNDDLKETADSTARQYSFEFSGLRLRSSNYDYYETAVSFTLGEKYNIERAEIIQDYYENNDYAQGLEGYIPTFLTDENGKTVPNKSFSNRIKIVIEQTTGERTNSNPYSSDMFKFQSFDLVFNNEIIEDNGVIYCDMSDKRIYLQIDNIEPSTADFSQDIMYLNDGAYSSDVNSSLMLNAEGYLAFRSSDDPNRISVTLRNGGVWTLIVKTAKVTKTVTINVTGVAPDTMDAQIRNDATGVFYAGDSKSIAINGSVCFFGAVNKYANAAQTAEIVSDNAAYATVETIVKDGLTYFTFSATQEGVYEVRVTSTANPSLHNVFTFTVMEMPDYVSILSGNYVVQSMEGDIYELEFSPENDGDRVNGTVKITRTPTFDDNTPDTANAVTQTLAYEVNFEYLEVELDIVFGSKIGVLLDVDAEGRLILIDQYDNEYILQRA